MATFEKRGRRWRARVRLLGHNESESFRTKSEAQVWAAQTEADIVSGKHGNWPDKSFGDLLERYLREVTPHKDGSRWEELRINRLLGHGKGESDPLVSIKLRDLGPEYFADWRDRRLRQVSPATVLREWNLLSAACTRAVREWRWLSENPMSNVRRPKKPRPRDRRVHMDEIERIKLACGYSEDGPVEYFRNIRGQSNIYASILRFRGLPGFLAVTRCLVNASICDVNRSFPSASPLLIFSLISLNRSVPTCALNNSW